MKIAFVEPHLGLCGGIRRIINFANSFVLLGHDVSVFIPDHFADTGQTGNWLVRKFPVYGISDAMKHIEITGFEKKEITPEFDAVIFNEETQIDIVRNMRAKVKIFWALHYPCLHKDINIMRAVYHGGVHLFANSQWTADMLFAETGAMPEIIHGGIDHAIFHPPAEPIEKEYDVLFYGATRNWKGGKFAERVLKKLGVTYKKFGDDSKIPQNEMYREYAKARIYFSASWYEGWNWPALEAMACGTPVVMTQDGGSDDYAIHGWNCYKIPFYDSSLAEKAIRELLSDRKTQKRFIENGLKAAHQFVQSEEAVKFIQKISNLYSKQ